MNHYIYLLEFPNGMKYIGCRSCNTTPELDVLYLGSGRALPEKRECTKTILNTYSTRLEAVQAEIQYIMDNDCTNSIEYYNLRLATYDRHGDIGPSTNVGKTKENTDYIRQANEKRKQYRGEARTPAQKAHDAKMTGKSTGPNPAKARKGTDNQGFVPWYSINPQGVLQEYRNTTKQEMAKVFEVTYRQLGHRFHYTNIDKPSKSKTLKGWTFGNI